MHCSRTKSPFKHLSKASNASAGVTSVRKPRTPMLMARIGGSGLGITRPVLRIVPSPPIVMIKSTFISSSRKAAAVFLMCFAKLGSRKTDSPLSSKWAINFVASFNDSFSSTRATKPTTLNNADTAYPYNDNLIKIWITVVKAYGEAKEK